MNISESIQSENRDEARVKAYVISMPDAHVRRESMRSQLDCTGLDWRFFDAHTTLIDGLSLERKCWPRVNGRELKNSEIGCYASHYDVMQNFANDNTVDVAMVFEDDAVIDIEYISNVAEILSLARRYGYIKFNTSLIAPSSLVYIQGRRRLLRFRKSVYGGLAYVIDKKTARRFVDHLRKVRRPVDMELDRFWAHGVPILCLYQPVAIESSKPTQIGDRSFTVKGWNRVVWKFNNQIEKLRCLFSNLLYDVKIRKV